MHSQITSRDDFWRFAERAKHATQSLAAQRMQVLKELPLDALRQICIQYRFFTIDYISDLALLVSRLPFGGLRSLLSQILSEELGEGNPDKAHPEVYDRFLSSIGISHHAMRQQLPTNQHILGTLTDELSHSPIAFGVGLRGMGGECLCQTYLTVMFEHMCAHPFMRAEADRIDWDFWTIHTGEEDIVHGELTTRAIDEYILHDPGVLPELARGYERSIEAWNQFWENIFEAYAPRMALAQ